MPLARVWQDDHGLYVRTNGTVFRPQRSATTRHWPVRPRDQRQPMFGDAPSARTDMRAHIVAGEKIAVSHMSQTPLARVGHEVWFSHGAYFDAQVRTIPSVEVWEPVIR